MTRSEQLRTIHKAYQDLTYMPDGFRDVREYLYDLNLKAERTHRKGTPYGVKNGLTVSDAAQLFTVRYLLDGVNEPKRWKLDAILNIRHEILIAQEYAVKFSAQLAEWAQRWTPLFADVDYAFLMK
ncbi:MAG: hypothetical protein WBQ59_23180 [Candidatus Acidiferrum sp.]